MSSHALLGTIAEPVDEYRDHALRGFGMTVACRHAQACRGVEEFVGRDVAIYRTGGRCGFEQFPERGPETLFAARRESVERRIARVQRLREPMLGGREIDEIPHPEREGLERWVGGRKGVRRIGATVQFLGENGGNEIGPPRKVPIHRADAHAGAFRDVAHRRIDAGFGEDLFGRLQQRDEVALRVGTHPTPR